MSDLTKPTIMKALLADTPMGRLGDPQEFAHFAASIIENGYINGVALRLSGGKKLSHH